MNALEIGYRRQMAPNVKVVSRGFLNQLATWLRAGMGLGIVFFMALTTLTVLGHGANWIQETAKQDRIVKQEDRNLVVPRTAYASPVLVSRPAVEKEKQDYRIIREQNRFVTDLVGHLSRTVSRFTS